jgi:hypothetical protein
MHGFTDRRKVSASLPCKFVWALMASGLMALSTATAAELLTFDVHFCVITSNKAAHAKATLAQLNKEVDILNQYFVSESRAPLVRFRFKSAHFWHDVAALDCALVKMGDTKLSTGYLQAFNQCQHPQVRDPNAINFYVYDETPGVNSHGRRNSNRPFVMVDWARLNHAEQSAEEHEMGHAFGLGHMCVPGARGNTPTNIMASHEDCQGSGGLRNIGFNAVQVSNILHYASLIHKRLKQ